MSQLPLKKTTKQLGFIHKWPAVLRSLLPNSKLWQGGTFFVGELPEAVIGNVDYGRHKSMSDAVLTSKVTRLTSKN